MPQIHKMHNITGLVMSLQSVCFSAMKFLCWLKKYAEIMQNCIFIILNWDICSLDFPNAAVSLLWHPNEVPFPPLLSLGHSYAFGVLFEISTGDGVERSSRVQRPQLIREAKQNHCRLSGSHKFTFLEKMLFPPYCRDAIPFFKSFGFFPPPQ